MTKYLLKIQKLFERLARDKFTGPIAIEIEFNQGGIRGAKISFKKSERL